MIYIERNSAFKDYLLVNVDAQWQRSTYESPIVDKTDKYLSLLPFKDDCLLIIIFPWKG